jgi:hypothetical protein
MFIGQQFPWRLHWNRLSNCRKSAGHQALLGSRSQVRLSGNLPSRCNGVAISIISRAAGPFTVRVMKTNEELMIRPTHPPSHALLGKELFMKSTEEPITPKRTETTRISHDERTCEAR